MRASYSLFNFYIQSSIHTALSVTSLVALTGFYFNFSTDIFLLGFVFTASVTGYNFVKYAGIARLHHRRLTKSLKAIQVFSFFAFFVMIYFALQLPSRIILPGFFVALLTVFYAVPLLPERKNLRDVSGLKIGIIALVWALTAVIIPVIYAGKNIDEVVVLLFVQRFLWVIVLTLPFEIRDLAFDDLSLGTIPQRMGVKNTKILGITLLIIIGFMEYFLSSFSGNSLWIALLIFSATALLLLFSKEKQSVYYTAFWVEAVPVFWLIFELIINVNSG